MHISWHGLSCFRIQTKETTILIDPFTGVVGLTSPRLQADIALFSDSGNPALTHARKTPAFCVDQPGEYEIRSVAIRGIRFEQQNGGRPTQLTLYTLRTEGVVIGHLGAIGEDLSADALEAFNEVDVLILPVGGRPVLDAKKAVEVASEIEPRLLIPCYFQIAGLKLKLGGLELFCKELGLKAPVPVEKLRVSKKDLPEEMQLVVLRP